MEEHGIENIDIVVVIFILLMQAEKFDLSSLIEEIDIAVPAC